MHNPGRRGIAAVGVSVAGYDLERLPGAPVALHKHFPFPAASSADTTACVNVSRL